MSLNCGTKGPIVHPSDDTMENHGGMILTGENRGTRTETCPSATLSTTYPTDTDPGANPVLRGGSSANNCLRHDTAKIYGPCHGSGA
jgi:hypothetical protein